ncbi:MAG: DUF3990 domain-containing protein [Dysgonamonadaceae bacterium]|jgi:hypothetical protein|nr:DUF3990 domain-containing protein [Dysgonamonadaceae bacterium]
MKVYHGSYLEIAEIDLAHCEVRRDFGRGFYVTKLREQAEIWAVRKGKEKKAEGYITEYDFDEYFFENERIKVLRFEDYNEEWLDFVVLNRKNANKQQQAHDYDIVEGPVADDKITTRIDEYIDGFISKEQFLSDLVYNPSHQMCFCTVQSLQALSLSKGRIDSAIYHIDSDVLQALMIDYGISETEATDIYYTSETFAKLADETTAFYKKSWTEIYEMLKKEIY